MFVSTSFIGAEIKRLKEIAETNIATCVPGMQEKLGNGAHKSIQVLMEILDDDRNDTDMLKIKAHVALDILSRAGFGPVKQINVQQTSLSAVFTSEDLKELKKRANECSRF